LKKSIRKYIVRASNRTETKWARGYTVIVPIHDDSPRARYYI